MKEKQEECSIIVDHVYKTFEVYMDKANSIKEKMLFWKRNRKEKRYGLGLAIAKSTVEKYNGKISVECKDGVTTFKVVI